MGACYEAKGQFDIALLVYTNGKASEEGDCRLLKHLGIAAVYAERYTEAIDSLRTALLRGDQSAKTLVFLGYCFERQDKWEEDEAHGVGRSRTLDQNAGLGMARCSLDLLPDAISWEVLSACEARAGNFEEAHQIQEHLSASEENQAELVRRREAMRTLRRNVPLDEHLVARTLVA